MKRSDAPRNPLQGLLCNALHHAPANQLVATVNDMSLMEGTRSLTQDELNRRQIRSLKAVLDS